MINFFGWLFVLAAIIPSHYWVYHNDVRHFPKRYAVLTVLHVVWMLALTMVLINLPR